MVGTISDVYLDLRNELRHHGVTSAQLEARELLAFALEIPRDVLNERSGSFLFDAQLKRLEELKQRRLAGEPLAHIIGEWDFYSLTFHPDARCADSPGGHGDLGGRRPRLFQPPGAGAHFGPLLRQRLRGHCPAVQPARYPSAVCSPIHQRRRWR